MMLYYPQETTLEMGPTHVLAGSQYWTIDTEKVSQGEDILPDASGHVSMFLEGSRQQRRQRLQEAEQHLLGPSATRAEVLAEDVSLTVPAGTCVLMHYDLFHRAGFRAQEDAPTRFMFKFQFIRTREPTARSFRSPSPPPLECSPRSASPSAASPISSKSELEAKGIARGTDLCRHRRQLRRRSPWRGDEDTAELPPEEVSDAALAHELLPVTADIRSWLLGIAHPSESLPPEISAGEAHQEVEQGLEVLRNASGCLEGEEIDEAERTEHDEVKLVSAAYSLARSPDRTWLSLLCALTGKSEALARAACHALAAAGHRAAPALVPLLKHDMKRVREAAAFALAECARPTTEVLTAFEEAILNATPWSWEVAHLLQALSCLAARSHALGEICHSQRCVELAMPYVLPSAGHNLICEHACLVVLLAGELQGEVGEVAVAALRTIIDKSADPYTVGFAAEILRRQNLESEPSDFGMSELQEKSTDTEGVLLDIT